VRVGRYGAYICRQDKKSKEEVCASLPDGQAPGDVSVEVVEKLIDQKINGADALGKDPKTGKPVYVLTGRYGPYVQLGDEEPKKEEKKPKKKASAKAVDKEVEKPKEKLKRVSIPLHIAPESVDMKIALSLLSLPRNLGVHPGTGKDIKLGLGRFGPYVVCDGDYRSIPKGENFLETTYERAMELFSQPKKGRGQSTPLKELGEHPKTSEKISVLSGKYGPYIKCGKVNVSLPEDMKPETITIKEALLLLESKIEAKKPARKKTRDMAANG
jgi:DNA topoisomerase-1